MLLPILNALSAGFTMIFSTITGKYTYGYAGTATLIGFEFAYPNTISHQMGFAETSVNNFATGALISSIVVDFISTSTLFLHSDMVEDQTSILQEVYADNSVPFSNLVYNCKFPAMYSKNLRNNTSSVFNFSLVDEHNAEVDLNGHELLLTILLYRKENLTKILKEVLLSKA
jgi:hypothetical protein